jgi:hypothetical protein
VPVKKQGNFHYSARTDISWASVLEAQTLGDTNSTIHKTTIVDCVNNRPLPCDLYRASSADPVPKAAMTHGFPWETLRDRVRGAAQRKKVMEGHQKLTLFEEGVIENYCNTLYGWGWPARIYQIWPSNTSTTSGLIHWKIWQSLIRYDFSHIQRDQPIILTFAQHHIEILYRLETVSSQF